MVGRTFRYDANGNQAAWDHDQNGTRRTLVWDDENRLQSLFDNGHEKAYVYDDAGQRVIKRGPQGETVYVNQWFTMRNGQAGTKHVFAGTERIVSKLMQQDGPGANPKGKTPFEKDLYYFHPDHLGSSAYVTDAKAKLYQHLEYFPFGETWVEEVSNTQRTPYWYTAKELDEETGLYYYGARYYDPRTSVWQSADPILGDYLPTGNMERDAQLPGMGGVFKSMNLGLYAYTHHNPIRFIDPDGNEPVHHMIVTLERSTYNIVSMSESELCQGNSMCMANMNMRTPQHQRHFDGGEVHYVTPYMGKDNQEFMAHLEGYLGRKAKQEVNENAGNIADLATIVTIACPECAPVSGLVGVVATGVEISTSEDKLESVVEAATAKLGGKLAGRVANRNGASGLELIQTEALGEITTTQANEIYKTAVSGAE